jgi:LAO/AO transport system kinase
MYESINEQLKNSFYNNPLINQKLQESEADVLEGRKTSFIAAQDLLDLYYTSVRNA